ncbi:phage integrase N-terminal domain-containing protein [Affinibrenneria salicis]|uniref:phage integrase N-terminal domain-containing protein n=1 Tax=Affinibrenneria salicis TaxID=2590031 RepID=UPI001CC773A4|nr:phage integrase N-terminal domain-containing protein [Affinibrenneria salicis]
MKPGKNSRSTWNAKHHINWPGPILAVTTQLKARHIESYVRERLEQGITKRSLQNEMAALRCLLKQAGRDRLAASERLSNKSLGLTGAYSPHSLRYAWAKDAIRHYLAQRFSEKETLALVAMDLGHGDGRGRYVAQVYGRRGEE